ncbi:MAG: OmpA family protein [Holosporales bacterium]|jgi:chemotaxis protein MotB|nr:OmpA family protein [Holosporales bacterium]
MILWKKHHGQDFNVWPCFVDALSSLLIIIIFVILGFFISHVFLSGALSDSDTSLKKLQIAFWNLQKQFAQTSSDNVNLKGARDALEQQMQSLLQQFNELQCLFKKAQDSETTLQADNKSLQEKIELLRANISALNLMLDTEKKQANEKESQIKSQMEAALAQKATELRAVIQELEELKKQIPENILQNPELLKYRSDFFALLQNVIGGRSDIRVVGDRFVFQAEVLFPQGSDKIGKQGAAVLDAFVEALNDVTSRIPKTINWVLIVDGHTDKIPIHNDTFDSNLELSAFRAVSVVKYLISKGVPPEHLAAAGFAEHFPLTKEPSKMAKNRRIEFRLDQR